MNAQLSQMFSKLPVWPSVVRSFPLALRAWRGLAQARATSLPQATQVLLREHEVVPTGHAIRYFWPEFARECRQELRLLSNRLGKNEDDTVLTDWVLLLIQKKSIYQCRDAHTEGGYYDVAEGEMAWQWDKLIYPHIEGFDFTSTLEIAPGHGRNSAKLAAHAGHLYLVDVNQTCIDACQKRFGARQGNCVFSYFVTNGDSLPFIEDQSITAVYSFDSMVHFDKTIIKAYLLEFARVMRPGAKGFVHHSNLGESKPNSDWAKNHGNRSDMSATIFSDYCAEVGLTVETQVFHGLAEGRGIDRLDCVTVFRK
jgi:SAM-dependent methyltransferase